MSREAIVEGLKDELAQSQEELARLEAALKHVSKVPDSEQLITTSPVPSTPVKRGRGRPKGSRNRPKDVIKAEKMQKGTGKKRGRPKGSKNKPKLALVPDFVLGDIQPTDAAPAESASDLIITMPDTPTDAPATMEITMDETSVSQPPEVSAIADMPVVEIAPDTSMEQEMDVPSTPPSTLELPPIQTREALFNSVTPE